MTEPAIQASAPRVARGIADLGPEDLAHGNLTLPLSCSLWMRQTGADLETLRVTMLEIRRALLRSSALDSPSEPVPLLAGDDRTVVLHLGVYLGGLVGRAASSLGCSRTEAVERALERLAA